uniref:hypothetical protein n=1 Tax=uncultured Thiodictyon sp. TaxID=1846217 RepID=UPI0025E17B7C
MTTSLSLTPIDGEPRIHDLTLAVWLGFDRPVNIRNIVKRNEAKLLKFGPLSTVERVINGGNAKEFYLNQKQSIFICMKSETANAFDVQVEIVHVFDAHLNGGRPVAALPQDLPTALRAWADEVERRTLVERELEASRPKIALKLVLDDQRPPSPVAKRSESRGREGLSPVRPSGLSGSP